MSTQRHRGDPLRVLIAGGGVAALETVLALRHTAGVAVEITVVTPEPNSCTGR